MFVCWLHSPVYNTLQLKTVKYTMLTTKHTYRWSNLPSLPAKNNSFIIKFPLSSVFRDKEIGEEYHNVVKIENVEKCMCLGSNMMYDLDCQWETATRPVKTDPNMKAIGMIWESKVINLHTKLSKLNMCVFSSMLYGCEAWIIMTRKEGDWHLRRIATEKSKNRMDAEDQKQETISELQLKEEPVTESHTEKVTVIWTYLQNEWQQKSQDPSVLIEGLNRTGRLHRGWADNIIDWCKEASLQWLSHNALDRITVRTQWRRHQTSMDGKPVVVDGGDDVCPLPCNIIMLTRTCLSQVEMQI